MAPYVHEFAPAYSLQGDFEDVLHEYFPSLVKRASEVCSGVYKDGFVQRLFEIYCEG